MSMWKILLIDPEVVVQEPCQTSSDRKPGIAYGMTSSDRYAALEAHPRLVQRDREEEPERERDRTTQSVANTNVQTKTRRNGSRTSGS